LGTLARPECHGRDREIDQINHDIADDLTVRMADQPDRIPGYLNLLLILRHLERVGDHGQEHR
jgi:phosphate uptake regulator